ncbi:COMM domain-containing protein 5-like, partial [Lingula anatina]
MSIIQVTGSGGGIASDRTSFVGGRTPQDIADMVKLVKKMDKQTFRKLLQIAITALEDKPVTPEMFKVLQSKSLSEEMLAVTYSGLYSLLKAALRLPQSSLKQEIFKEDLQELNIPAEFIPDLASVVFGSRRPRLEQVI